MIRLTFLTDTQRSATQEYETDDLAAAVIAYAARSFRLKPEEEGHATNRGPDKWLIAFAVERDDARFEEHEVADVLRRMASIELAREASDRDSGREPAPPERRPVKPTIDSRIRDALACARQGDAAAAARWLEEALDPRATAR